jgi:hypothetical protein
MILGTTFLFWTHIDQQTHKETETDVDEHVCKHSQANHCVNNRQSLVLRDLKLCQQLVLCQRSKS